MKNQTGLNHWTNWVLFAALVCMCLFTSCESRSGHRASQPEEKVVIAANVGVSKLPDGTPQS